jgi:hypothetical protein
VIPSKIDTDIKGDRIMLVGIDEKQILERRLRAAGCRVVIARDHQAALNYARHEIFDSAILVSKGSLLNVAEVVFNLRDLNPAITILVLVDRLAQPTNRFLRQLLNHPIERTRILTRRQLQKQLISARQPAPPGAST